MARMNHVKKARKDQGSCRKCGKELAAGCAYKWTKPRYGGRKKWCTDCTPSPSDLTGAKYGVILDAIEGAQEEIGGWTPDSKDASEVSSFLENVASEAESVGDEYRESAENVREHFPDSEPAQEWEDYADELDSWKDELEGFEPDEYEGEMSDDDTPEDEDEYATWAEGIRDEANSLLDEMPYPSF